MSARTALYGETASAELCIDIDGSTSSGGDVSWPRAVSPTGSIPWGDARTEEIIAATTAVRSV